jgi:hypothetical protein
VLPDQGEEVVMDKPMATLALAGAVLGNAAYAACTAQSPAHTVALVELYTSEGCSDCPPADKWLSKLKPGVERPAVAPLSLHVDYWDYIGWKDPFAKALFSARQREQTKLQGRTVVYTPQVMLGGKDYRSWRNERGFEADVKRINATPARASITLSLSASSDGLLEAKAQAESSVAGAVLFVALTENGLSNRISSGENRGVTLSHDWVAREWTGPAPVAAGKGVHAGVSARLPAARAGAIAFVQDRRTGEVLQALSLPGCGPGVSSAGSPSRLGETR